VIGRRELSSILVDHILDSLSCFLFEPLLTAQRLADIGSGGGLPGIPIKIARPALQTTLVESTRKKARFLRDAIEQLALHGIEVVDGRVEEVARVGGHRGTYEVVTARAVARLSVVAEYCVPLLKVGGYVISMKAKLQGEELSEGERAAKRLGAKVSEVLQVPHLPEVGARERRLVIFEKVGETPGKYPRKVGVPAKKPLGVV
jgi:16S rRNA (guanine527-N7)-methyltransferase